MQAHSIASIRLCNPPSARVPGRRRLRHLLFAIAAIGLLSIGQAAAQDAEEAASVQADAAAKPGRNGKVCEYEAVTGSRMKKRVCYTPEQWEARERAGKELTRELDNRPIGERKSG